jgi:glycosyltransferase involved in cell wall biosynthesis
MRGPFKEKSLGYTCYRSFTIEDVLPSIIDIEKPDIFILQGGDRLNQLFSILEKTNKPIVNYLHTPNDLDTFDFNNISGLTSFVANSRFTKDRYATRCEISAVIPPIIISKNYKVSGAGELITLVNPAPHKGLELVEQLVKLNPKLCFMYVCVSESQHNSWKNKELPHNLHIHPPTNDMKSIYSKTKIALMPSNCDETWGRIATEAQLSGIPILASNRGGLPESVGPGGILMDYSDDKEQWNTALHTLIAEYKVYTIKALKHSQRKEIQAENLVTSFIKHIKRQIKETNSVAK